MKPKYEIVVHLEQEAKERIRNKSGWYCNIYPVLEAGLYLWYSTGVGAWRSPVAHLHGVQGAASSNLAAPTKFNFNR
jgi:hypothetical protein